MKALSAVLAVIMFFCVASPAHAASISGSARDPRDTRSDKPDLERLTIGYDDAAGVVTATFRFYQGPYYAGPSLYLRFGLSKMRQGGCLANPTEPDLDFRAEGDYEGEGIPGWATLNARTGSTIRIVADYSESNTLDWPYRLEAPQLIRAGYRCVTRVFADDDSYVEDGDQLSKFCLGSNDCFEPAPPPSPTPTPRPPQTPTPQQPPAPTSPAAPAPDPAPAPVVVVVVPGQPAVVTSPPSSSGQRSVSRAQAQRRVRTALRRVYKRAFTSGSRYRSRCRRVSATTQSCRVSWRFKHYRYNGKVVVRLRAEGYSARVDVIRRRR